MFLFKSFEYFVFEFGGSTVVVLFPKDSIDISPDLIYRSGFPAETYLHMGSEIGRWKS